MKYLLFYLLVIHAPSLFSAPINDDTLYVMESREFNEGRAFQVHLPKNFEISEKLPLMIVFDAQWEPYFELVTSTVDYLIEVKEFPRIIIVGIHQEKRQFELTSAPVNENWQVPNLGGAHLLENHLINEVIPRLKEDFKTSDFLIGLGHSLGGTFVLNSLVDCPSLFHSYIAMSPNLELDDEAIRLKIERNSTEIEKSNTFLFATNGDEGFPDLQFLAPVMRLDSAMQTLSQPSFAWHFRTISSYNHATIPLESIQLGLLKLSENWKISDERMKDIAESGAAKDEFKRFFVNLSNWIGDTVQPSNNDFIKVIAALEELEDFQQSIELNKMAIEIYPSSSVFYNGVAENLIKLGQGEEAKKYLELALEVLEEEVIDYAPYKRYLQEKYHKNLSATIKK